MSSMLNWALWYAQQGLSIIPVQGKIPLIKWAEFQERRASEEEIKSWWEKWPEADIGCVTGAISNRLVLDVDGEIGAALVVSKGVPETYTVKTKKGTQYHFSWPVQNIGKTTLVGLEDQIDTRGESGYCKLPPSKFLDDTGRYSSEGTGDCNNLAPCPQWLMELMISKQRDKLIINRESGESWLKEKLDGLKEGNRNQTFTSLAGSLRSRGYSSADICELLTVHALQVDFSIEELKTICESVGQYAPKAQVNTDEIVVPSKILAEKSKVNWLVDPKLISVNSLSFLVGLPKSCKSWILMELALALATGTEWMGRFPCKQSRVIYLDQERAKDSTIERFNQLIAGRGIDAKALDEKFFLKPQSRTKIDLPQSYAAFDRMLEQFKPDIVLIDSFKKFHSKNELATQDMQVVFTKLDELRDKHGCSFVFIHHETKSVHERRKEHFEVSYLDAAGTIDLSQSADHFFNVLAYTEKDTSMMYHTANNHGAMIEPTKVVVRDMDTEKTKIRVEAR